MSDILTTIAAVEWIIVGGLFLWRLRHWNRRFSELYDEQAKQLVDYAVKKEVYNWDGVESVVAEALAHGNKVVINADW